jgi:carbon-monoxide dehydrogenase medium subunit
VKPPRFDYLAAGSVGEAVLALVDTEAKVLAGGQSLVPLLNMRVSRPALLVDINRVPGLDRIEVDGGVRLGALVRQADALASPELRRSCPLVCAALRHVGHPATRDRGTVVGSLAHADPAAELPAVALALDAVLVATGPHNERTIAAEAFFTGPFTTALTDGEILTEVVLPLQRSRPFGFTELSRRHGDFALAGAIVLFDPARIVLFGIGGRPERALEAEQALARGGAASEVATLAVSEIRPAADVHADGEYRRRAAAVLVRRAIEEAEGHG